MGIIKVKDRDGKVYDLEAQKGFTIMEIIRDAGLNIEAACGGCCACATCHVYITNDKFEKLVVKIIKPHITYKITIEGTNLAATYPIFLIPPKITSDLND